jgi:type IV secretory pathway TrbL component
LSRNQRFTLLGLAVVVLVVAFVVARSGGDSGSSDTKTTSSQTGGSGSGGATAPGEPAVQTVTVKNAAPVGGVKRLTFKHNDQIVFVVRSDTADEVHFHGYDVAKDVKAGGQVRFDVKATIEGRFEVELENHKTQIAQVEVQP